MTLRAPGAIPETTAGAPDPEFAVLGARAVRHAAAPMLALDLRVTEPTGRPIYMIALKIQMMIEPARRVYDDATRDRLVELFGAPERWAVTTRSLVWTALDVVVPAFTWTTTVAVPVACNYDLEVTAAKYLHSLPDGQAPLALHFNGIVYYAGDDGSLQMVLVPWTRSIDFRMPVAVWRDTVEHYYPNTGWVGLRSETLEALQRLKVQRGLATFDACVAELLGRSAMVDELEALVDSLLYEGYALYPYTPGAAKNSTPTPFGIVYPSAYAATLTSTFDHLELRCVLEALPDAVLHAEVRFLAADGERHRARARRVSLAGATVAALAAVPERVEAHVGDPGATAPLHVALSMALAPRAGGEHEVVLRVENRTPAPGGLERSGALRRSLLSTIPIVRVRGGRFVSALERPCASVNTFPVLATAADDAIIGAAIVLPDHPEIAPESRGGLFDSTEIEEALLLHVLALSDGEREEIEQQDPTVRAMVARASAATPADIVALHGRVTLRDPGDGDLGGARDRESLTPPVPSPGLADPTRGEESAEVDGVRFQRGAKVVIRPGAGADLHARLLDGRTATIERIFIDYDGRAHLGVTVDGDPGQDLMRDTGRYLFFFAGEVEVGP